jgi:hypothetical protein
VVVSAVVSAVDPGGGGASGAAFVTGKRLDGAEQKTTAHFLCWGAARVATNKQQHKQQQQQQQQHQLQHKQQHQQQQHN